MCVCVCVGVFLRGVPCAARLAVGRGGAQVAIATEGPARRGWGSGARWRGGGPRSTEGRGERRALHSVSCPGVCYCLCAARLAPPYMVHCAVCVFCPGYDSYCDCRRGHPRYGGAARCGVECIISCTRWTGGRAVPALGCTEGAAGRSGGARYVPPACRRTPIVCLGGEVHCAVAKKW